MFLLAWPRVFLHARYVDLDIQGYLHNALVMRAYDTTEISPPSANLSRRTRREIRRRF